MARRQATLLTDMDGRRLAVEMLLEASHLGLDEMAIDGAEYRAGRPQNDILARYLAVARQNAEIERGFLAVLTDIVGSRVDGSPSVAAEFYERIGSQ